jgi:glycosyltransferase involved in cell wall biosynthesis
VSSYAVVTPAHDEAENLPRLAAALAEQALPPAEWIVVEDSSTDGTPAILDRLAAEHPWLRVVEAPRRAPGLAAGPRGGRVVRAFTAGLDSLGPSPTLVAKVDADISFGPDYFDRLADAFAADPRLGIASGTCYQEDGDGWRQFYGTAASVWGAARVYRRVCLEQLLPLEERMGWDGIDVVMANVEGWKTEILLDLPFFHHRLEGSREDGNWRAWAAQGEAAHYMGYRLSYVFARTIFRARRDPAALSMLATYIGCAAKRRPRYPNRDVREFIRQQQQFRKLPSRKREALGRV